MLNGLFPVLLCLRKSIQHYIHPVTCCKYSCIKGPCLYFFFYGCLFLNNKLSRSTCYKKFKSVQFATAAQTICRINSVTCGSKLKKKNNALSVLILAHNGYISITLSVHSHITTLNPRRQVFSTTETLPNSADTPRDASLMTYLLVS